jgi:hypothetical protein
MPRLRTSPRTVLSCAALGADSLPTTNGKAGQFHHREPLTEAVYRHRLFQNRAKLNPSRRALATPHGVQLALTASFTTTIARGEYEPRAHNMHHLLQGPMRLSPQELSCILTNFLNPVDYA